MISCPNCGKENQDHYKFCLGCGAKLPAPGQAPAPPPPPNAAPPPPAPPPPPQAAPPPPPQAAPPPPPAAPPPQAAPPPPQAAPPPPPAGAGQPYGPPPGAAPAYGHGAPPAPPPPSQPGPYGQPQQGTYGQPPPNQPYQAPYQGSPAPAQPAPPAAGRGCPNCGTENPPQFKFCGGCGSPLEAAPPPSQPQVQPPPPPQPDTSVGPTPAPPPDNDLQGKTMFMDANQRPAMAGGVATIRLVLLREDGTEGGVLVIEGGPESVGRAHGPPFDSDAYLDPHHAELTATHEGLQIDSSASLNGVYTKLEGRAELQHHDLFRVGQELLFYEDLPEPTPTEDGTERMGSPNPGYWGRVSVMVAPGRAVAGYPIKEEGVTIGRENGEITFPDDGYVSGSHCRIVGDDEGVFLEDLGSSNGTYMRVRPGQLVRPGTLVLIGQQLFRVEPG